MLDIDHFKMINDKFGHDEGDRILIFLAETFRHGLRKADVAGRYGGEEFIFLLPHTDREKACGVVNLVRQLFYEGTLNPTFRATGITFSAGLVEYPVDAPDVGELIKTADTRMYRAKQLGRNRIVSTDGELTDYRGEQGISPGSSSG